MPLWVSAMLADDSWVFVALTTLVALLLGFIVVMVRSAKSNMTVRIGKIIEVRRGSRDADPLRNSSQARRLQSVDKMPREPDPPAEVG